MGKFQILFLLKTVYPWIPPTHPIRVDYYFCHSILSLFCSDSKVSRGTAARIKKPFLLKLFAQPKILFKTLLGILKRCIIHFEKASVLLQMAREWPRHSKAGIYSNHKLDPAVMIILKDKMNCAMLLKVILIWIDTGAELCKAQQRLT